MKRISINPITRLEGHGKIEIFLDKDGNVANTHFQVPELRGFEQFCVGRRAEEMPIITNRICGVCPEAHHIASVKALDRLFAVEPPPAANKIRELLYMAFFVTDHATHFYVLGGPDFIVGPDAPPGERNILGVIRKVGLGAGKKVMECRARNHHVIQTLGGRPIHPVAGLPGGWSKAVAEDDRRQMEEAARQNIEFALFSLGLFETIVLQNPAYAEMVQSDVYCHRTYYMGTVDERNRLNLFDGQIRVVDPDGREFVKYHPSQYLEHIAERVEPWTYLKFPCLKQVGWKGFRDGPDSGVYCATPLSRLNVCDGLATPRAQEQFEKFYQAFGAKKTAGRYQPVHPRLATHWARLIEMLYASERMLELATDPEITSPDVRNIPQTVAGRGVGCVEAPRGTLIHDYYADGDGILRKVNLIVGTTNNHAAIAMSIRKAADKLIQAGRVVEEGLLNRIEMAFRLYDPCLSCATHSLSGAMPLMVNVIDHSGERIRSFRRDG
jgi:F420-non-reducing hydrogenase large subunit